MFLVFADMTELGNILSKLKIAALVMGCAFMFSGCITSSSEDDYIAGVLAEAMQEYPPEGVTSAPPAAPAVVSTPIPETTSAPVVSPPVTIPAPVVVSIPPPQAVSATPGPVVSAPVASAPAKAVEPAAVTPVVVSQPPVAPSPSPAAIVESPAVPVAQTPVVSAPPVAVNIPVAEPMAAPVISSVPQIIQPAIPTIQPDSVLWISVSEDPSLNGRYMVNDASAIDFGYVGLVFLQDMRVEQAEAELKRVLEGRYLKTATVVVKLAKASYDRVAVQGTVEMPAEIKIGPGATIPLSEALRRAGGLRGNRQNCQVKIIRGGMRTPFGAAAEGQVFSLTTPDGVLKVPDAFLRNDDLVYVFSPSSDTPQAVSGAAGTGAGGKRVVLLGEVPRRGVVEFSENEPCTLMYLLFKIGGLPRFAKANKITVVRRAKDGSEKRFVVDGEKLMSTGRPEDDLVLETGDRIVVPARKISFF